MYISFHTPCVLFGGEFSWRIKILLFCCLYFSYRIELEINDECYTFFLVYFLEIEIYAFMVGFLVCCREIEIKSNCIAFFFSVCYLLSCLLS